jgi:hypothetical protein
MWEEVSDGQDDSGWNADGELVRSRRESLWEEAEIDRLDFTERTGRWGLDSIEQGRTPLSNLGGSFRRGSAMSLLHQLLGQDQSTEEGVAGREDGRVSPFAATAHTTVSICTGGDAVSSCAPGTEVTLRSPKCRQLPGQDSCIFLNPPPFGPR